MLNDDIKNGIDISDPYLLHYGVKGMKWGVRKKYEPVKRQRKLKDIPKNTVQKGIETAYSLGAKINPREHKYAIKRTFNKLTAQENIIAEHEIASSIRKGILTSNETALKIIDKKGIEQHKKAVYSNLDSNDIAALKKYTDAAVYSRGVNGYLAIGEPREFAGKAQALKKTIRKNKIDNQVVYRSLNLKFSTDGIAKKLDKMSEAELAKQFDGMTKNFKNKNVRENRVYSTSTSPSFAIDTWRKVNPTAAKTYNSYLIIDCKSTPGLYADGRLKGGKKIVNTRSNQEVILAPNSLTYKKLTFDKERNMFAIHVDAN